MKTPYESILAVLVGVALAHTPGCTKKGDDATPLPAYRPPDAGAATPATPAPEAPKGPTGIISGVVTYEGAAPEMPRIQNGSDPACAKHELHAETVVVKDGKLKDVLVRVSPGQGLSGVPAAPVIVDQTQCMFRPRVQGGVVGQLLEVRNTDQTAHNIHAKRRELLGRQGTDTLFNRGQPKGGRPMKGKLLPDIEVYALRCDQHAWMRGYIVLSDNPHSATSNESGAYRIEGVPVGTYKLQSWHAFYGTKEIEVTVEEGKVATASFNYHAEKDKPAGM